MHAEEIVCAGFWVSTEGFAPSEDEGNYINSFEEALPKLITNAQYPSVLRTPRRKYHDHSYFIGKEGPKKWRNMSKVIQSQARFGLDNPVGAHVSPKMLQHIEMDIQPHDSPDSWALLSVPLSSAFLSQMSQSSPYSQSQPYSQGCPTCHTRLHSNSTSRRLRTLRMGATAKRAPLTDCVTPPLFLTLFQ